MNDGLGSFFLFLFTTALFFAAIYFGHKLGAR